MAVPNPRSFPSVARSSLERYRNEWIYLPELIVKLLDLKHIWMRYFVRWTGGNEGEWR